MNRLRIISILITLLYGSVGSGQSTDAELTAAQLRTASRSLSRLVASGGGALLNQNVDDRTDLPPKLRSWIQENRNALIGASKSPFPKPASWGVATTKENSLFLHVVRWPEDNRLTIPRLHNSITSVKILGQDTELKLKPNVTDWEIALPEKPKQRESLQPIIELNLDAPAIVATDSVPTVQPDSDGAIRLHARFAITHGEMLRFEPQSYKDTVGYWVRENDWAEWSCRPSQGGSYSVQLRYGCGDGQAGSEIVISVGDTQLSFKVESTGGFQAWRDVQLGTVPLSAGIPTTVTAKPKVKAKNAVMDIQQITLTPAAKTSE